MDIAASLPEESSTQPERRSDVAGGPGQGAKFENSHTF
jgi:hypothetical protein